MENVKTVLITGASSGLGAALAVELARGGRRIGLVARRAELLADVAAAVREAGGEPLALAADVTDRVGLRSAVEHLTETWGDIDLAVANAGLGSPTPAHRFPLDEAVRVMDVNFYGVLHLFDAVVPRMLARGSGRFAGVASLAGLRGMPTSSVYSASKAAVQAFLEASRVDLVGTGVGVTIINPGFVRTPMTDKNDFDMPFMIEAEEAARIMARGLLAGRREIEYPLPTTLASRLARLLPNAVYDAVMHRLSPGPQSKKPRDKASV